MSGREIAMWKVFAIYLCPVSTDIWVVCHERYEPEGHTLWVIRMIPLRSTVGDV